MTNLYNYFPNPRFDASKPRLNLTRCTASYYGPYIPAADQWPGMTLTATADGDNYGIIDFPAPANASLVAYACSIFDAPSQTGDAVGVFAASTNTYITNIPAGWNKRSGVFKVPADGRLRLSFRAPKTTGKKSIIALVMVCTQSDLDKALDMVVNGWFSGDLMPLNGGGSL